MAEGGRTPEAELYIKLARDVFPDEPANDPGFALADSSVFTLSYHSGKVYTSARKVAEAFDAFEIYKQRFPGITIPERIRLEIVNAQSKAAISANDLEGYISFLQSGLEGAVVLGSRKRYEEFVSTFQKEMPKAWLSNTHVRTVAGQYHLTRKS